MVLPSLRDARLLAEATLFTVLVPGTIVIGIPWLILGPSGRDLPTTATGVELAAAVPLVLGAVIYLRCLWDFVARGRGIPLPLDHPKQLVVTGLYAYVRNPMYLAVLLILIGVSVFFRSWALLLYTAAWFLIVNLVVVLYEEPALRRKFGAAYDHYRSDVRRWVPRRPGRS